MFTLKNVLVTSYNIGGSGQAEDVPMEDFAMNLPLVRVVLNFVQMRPIHVQQRLIPGRYFSI